MDETSLRTAARDTGRKYVKVPNPSGPLKCLLRLQALDRRLHGGVSRARIFWKIPLHLADRGLTRNPEGFHYLQF
jgi:hypothetical protein